MSKTETILVNYTNNIIKLMHLTPNHQCSLYLALDDDFSSADFDNETIVNVICNNDGGFLVNGISVQKLTDVIELYISLVSSLIQKIATEDYFEELETPSTKKASPSSEEGVDIEALFSKTFTGEYPDGSSTDQTVEQLPIPIAQKTDKTVGEINEYYPVGEFVPI